MSLSLCLLLDWYCTLFPLLSFQLRFLRTPISLLQSLHATLADLSIPHKKTFQLISFHYRGEFYFICPVFL